MEHLDNDPFARYHVRQNSQHSSKTLNTFSMGYTTTHTRQRSAGSTDSSFTVPSQLARTSPPTAHHGPQRRPLTVVIPDMPHTSVELSGVDRYHGSQDPSHHQRNVSGSTYDEFDQDNALYSPYASSISYDLPVATDTVFSQRTLQNPERHKVADEKADKKSTVPERRLATYAWLIISSMLGMLIRWALLNWDAVTSSTVLYPFGYCLFLGGFAIGFATGSERLQSVSQPAYHSTKYGMAGSLAPFSVFMEQVFDFLFLPPPDDSVTRDILRDVVHGLGCLGVGLALTWAGIAIGGHLARGIFSTHHKGKKGRLAALLAPKKRTIRKDEHLWGSASWADRIVSLLAVVLWAAAIAFAIIESSNLPADIFGLEVLLISLAFAPLGAFLRFSLRALSVHSRTFPIATFVSNVGGTAVVGILYLISHQFLPQTFSCVLMSAGIYGLGGSLSSLPSFVYELGLLYRPMHKYRYAIISLLVGQVVLLAFKGPNFLTLGNGTETCNTALPI